MRDPLANHLRELLFDVRGMVGVLVDECGWFSVLSERSERTVFQVECMSRKSVTLIPVSTVIFRPFLWNTLMISFLSLSSWSSAGPGRSVAPRPSSR